MGNTKACCHTNSTEILDCTLEFKNTEEEHDLCDLDKYMEETNFYINYPVASEINVGGLYGNKLRNRHGICKFPSHMNSL